SGASSPASARSRACWRSRPTRSSARCASRPRAAPTCAASRSTRSTSSATRPASSRGGRAQGGDQLVDRGGGADESPRADVDGRQRADAGGAGGIGVGRQAGAGRRRAGVGAEASQVEADLGGELLDASGAEVAGGQQALGHLVPFRLILGTAPGDGGRQGTAV